MNVLKLAQTVIKKDTFIYKAYTSRSLNNIGQYTPIYVETTLSGNIQPVNKNLYAEMGLDLQKTYITLHITNNLLDIDRSVSGDKIIYNGITYHLISKLQDWYSQRGFITILGVKVA